MPVTPTWSGYLTEVVRSAEGTAMMTLLSHTQPVRVTELVLGQAEVEATVSLTIDRGWTLRCAQAL